MAKKTQVRKTIDELVKIALTPGSGLNISIAEHIGHCAVYVFSDEKIVYSAILLWKDDGTWDHRGLEPEKKVMAKVRKLCGVL